jgi:phosphatidylglycerophosphatase A
MSTGKIFGQKIISLIATMGSVGCSKKAPGTIGSAVALPIGAALELLLGQPWFLIAIFCAFWVGLYSSEAYIKNNGGEDPQEIVIDELVGMWATLIAFPQTWWGYILAFIAFRFFDILKPWPVCWADQRFKGTGFGVMLDDLIAGIYPFVILIVFHLLSTLTGFSAWEI